MKILILVISVTICTAAGLSPGWGFYAHKKINRYAVFTLPSDLAGFYKKNIEYISEHAVDPDKRRYAIRNEATRHYIDIDNWDTIPFKSIPRNFDAALLKFGEFLYVAHADTLIMLPTDSILSDTLFTSTVWDDRYSNVVELDSQLIYKYLDHTQFPGGNDIAFLFANRLAEFGTLPWVLEEVYARLVKAFESRNPGLILRISADLGHYLGDAHVPLHTTLNYDGQLTGQDGIHAFWESRLPELFAENTYDFMVGRAEYIPDIRHRIWEIIESSHRDLSRVLKEEVKVRESVPEDLRICYDERGESMVKTECREFAEAYHEALDGMVENRMRLSVHTIGSFWYSAWIDAGQPDMDKLEKKLWEPESTLLIDPYGNN